MSLKQTPVASRFAASAYLSQQEGKKPMKTLMKIFSKWTYEELKENLRAAYYLIDYGMEEGSLSKQNGLIHTQHKLVAIATILAENEDEYFSQSETFTFKRKEVGNFWDQDHCLPFHHLSKGEYGNPIALLRSFDFAGLQRMLHGYSVFLVGRDRYEVDEEVLKTNDVFQQLERLIETLYLLIVQRIEIEY